jgi:hypothetical protein
MGRAYNYDIHIILPKHLRSVGFYGALQVVAVLVSFCIRAISADQSPNLRTLIFLKGLYILFRHPTATNNRCAKPFHVLFPFLLL